MNHFKLGVEVVRASNLMAKDGQGSCSSFVELYFDNQKFRTTVKERDLNPVWNEQFYFNISDSVPLAELSLEAYVYNMTSGTNSKSFLGKVRIAGTSFVPFSDALVIDYPLEKRSIFSRVKGDLGLRVFLTNNPSIRASNPLPAVDAFTSPNNPLTPVNVVGAQSQVSSSVPPAEKKKNSRHTFHTVPKENYQQPHSTPHVFTETSPRYAADEMKYEQPKVMAMHSSSFQQPADFAIKETSPFLGGGRIIGGHVIRGENPFRTYDLVESMQYLFVRVVKARDLPTMDISGSLDPYVEVRLGNYKEKTKIFQREKNPEWNEVFAFPRERMQASFLEVLVKDKDLVKDDFVGILKFDLTDVPTRVPPDSPLAPEWYWLEDKKGERVKKGELMLSIWIGTQADEAFPDAWHIDATTSSSNGSILSELIRSKVYHAPRLWYARVNIIEAQDLVVGDKSQNPVVFVKAQIGNQILTTRQLQSRTLTAHWNEELLFVAAEPFEDHLIISVEERSGSNKDEAIGRVHIPLSMFEKRVDDRYIDTRWFSLEKPVAVDIDQLKKDKFSSKIHLRLYLDGGYHVFDESTQHSSDLRPSARQLWKPSVGVLELGILNADRLHPMKSRDGKGTSDTYCVAKYGQKWVRTRTIVNSLCPRYNEQYTWEVFDPATVLTVGVFDNSQVEEKDSNGQKKDLKIGKVRIRLSTLQTGRVYTHSYPLLVLHRSGVKKMGEIHMAIRFSSTSFVNMMHIYSRPLLPKMHYIRPLAPMQVEYLRQKAVSIVATRLGRMEPPLRREVVEYMSDFDSHLWSMRKSKANFFRLGALFSGVLAIGRWYGGVCAWRNPITTVLVHVLFLMLTCFPELILPTVFLYMFLIGIWNYRFRPLFPPHMNTRLSHAENTNPDELDEEFDTFPSTGNPELVRLRYDRLRSIAGRVQTVLGDIATQGERLQALISWRDPRATALFMLFCLLAALAFYVTPIQVIIVAVGFYSMRHPRFRGRMPLVPINFFRRLPAKTDCML